MKNLKKYILLPVVALLFSTQGNAQDNALTGGVNKLINNYIELKNALVTGNGDLAKNKARDLFVTIQDEPVKSMNAEQSATWNSYVNKLKFDSRHISEVSIVAHQREHFASLSNNLFAVLKALRLNNTTLYYQYCTMNKLYYLSESATGKDPYMGMALCSKVKETLPAEKK